MGKDKASPAKTLTKRKAPAAKGAKKEVALEESRYEDLEEKRESTHRHPWQSGKPQ